MTGWGLVGILGAGLGRVTGRRLGRVALAACCGVAGYAYGAVMNVSVWVLGGTQGPAMLGAVFASSLWFDIAHVAGNVVFCLAFGPALVRALSRFRMRFEVRWRPASPRAPAGGLPTAVLALLAAAGLAAGATAGAPPARATTASPPAPVAAEQQAPPARTASATAPLARYLERAQNQDGGWGAAPGEPTAGLYTGWAVIGLAAAGASPGGLRPDGRSPADSLIAGLREVRSPADIERTILALVAAGGSPRAAGGRDLVAELSRAQRADGSFGGMVNVTSFAILALRAAGRPAGGSDVRRAARWLARPQNRDGGFAFFRRGAQSSVDDPAGAVQALVAAGWRGTPAVARAAGHLASRQQGDGGFAELTSGESNAQSTAWAVQGLIAAGRGGDVRRTGARRSALAYLRSLVAADGSVRYSRSSRQTPVWVTAQALTALAGRPFPLGVATPALATPAGAAKPAPAPAPRGGSGSSAVRGAAPGRRPHGSSKRRHRPRRTGSSPPTDTRSLEAIARTAGVVTALAVAVLP
jgi:energy-coupling factor transport system substrate-specific component